VIAQKEREREREREREIQTQNIIHRKMHTQIPMTTPKMMVFLIFARWMILMADSMEVKAPMEFWMREVAFERAILPLMSSSFTSCPCSTIEFMVRLELAKELESDIIVCMAMLVSPSSPLLSSL